jgi:hypothetical protein
MRETGDRVHPAQLDRRERVAIGADRDQARAHRAAGAPVDGVDNAVEQDASDQRAPVGLHDLVDRAQRHHRDDRRVPAADLHRIARHGDHVVAYRVVAVLLHDRDHVDQRKPVLDQQLMLFGQVGEPEVLGKVVRVHGVAEHHREVLDHRGRILAGHRGGEPVHLGVVCRDPRLVLTFALLVRPLPGAQLPQPPRLGLHPARAGLLVRLSRGGHLLLMQPLAAEQLADAGRTGRREAVPGRLGQWAAQRARVERRDGHRLLEPVEIDVVVDVQCGLQQSVEVGQPGTQVGVGGGRVGGARLHVQPLALPLPFDVGRRMLRGSDRQVRVAADQVPLLRRGRARPVFGRRLRGVRPLHVPDDSHASSSLPGERLGRRPR